MITKTPVGVVSLSPENLRGEPAEVVSELERLSRRGRLVGWGIWREMNELFRGQSEDFFREVSEGRIGYCDMGGMPVAVRQDKGTRWTIAVAQAGASRQFVVWDLWDWAKRAPRDGETPRQLYGAIRDVASALGVSPRHFYGASALAAPLLRLHRVPEHYPAEEECGSPDVARYALFSGRMQAVRIGVSDQPAREYDINSAYAWGLSQVPSLRGAILRPSNGIDWDWYTRYGRWALMDVEWDIPRQGRAEPTPIFPFPVRVTGGGVEYPRRGSGWYWSPLVLEARKHWRDSIRVLSVLHLETQKDTLPFAFLRDEYEKRKKFTKGSLHDTILKWTLSCVWGKLCQRLNPNWRTSSRCHLWAGMATSLVNAELLRVMMIDPRRVLHVHVDSILMSGRREHLDNLGPDLGQWRSKSYQEVQQYRVGVWRGRTPDGWVEKSQGVPAGAFPWDTAEEEWRNFGMFGRVELEWDEFQGFGAAGYSDWLTDERKHYGMPLQPGKLIDLRKTENWQRPGTKMQVWQPPEEVENPAGVEGFSEEGATGVFGLEHNPARSQERFRVRQEA